MDCPERICLHYSYCIVWTYFQRAEIKCLAFKGNFGCSAIQWPSYWPLLDKYTSLYAQVQDTNVSPTTEEKTVGYITTDGYIQALLRTYVSDYDYTTIDSITINDDAGTDTPDDYIALVNLTWSQKNSQETTEKMLDMYSQDMAARIYKDSSKVQEICIFWNVPYLNASAKWSFERGSDGMYKTDQIFN